MYTVSSRNYIHGIRVMDTENTNTDTTKEIPEEAIWVQQVQYAWLWSSMPWLVILAVLYYTDILIEGVPILGAIVSVVIMVPRYLSWRRTAYVITEEDFIYIRGTITGTQKYHIPLSDLDNVSVRYGFFGKSLGYMTIDLTLQNSTVASLKYIPILSEFPEQMQSRIGKIEQESEQPNENDVEQNEHDDSSTNSSDGNVPK